MRLLFLLLDCDDPLLYWEDVRRLIFLLVDWEGVLRLLFLLLDCDNLLLDWHPTPPSAAPDAALVPA